MALVLHLSTIMKRQFKSKQNILVIDTDREFCKSVRLYLEENYNVHSGQGLDNIDDTILLKQINLLLIDADFANQNLASILAGIRQKHPQLKIVIMYTYFSSDKKEEFNIAETADGMIAKPFDVQLLKEKVDLLLKSVSKLDHNH